MHSIVTITADLTPQLRNGIHHVLGDAAKEIVNVAEHAERDAHLEWYEKPIARFKRAQELLDLVGWSNPSQLTAVQVDLRDHHAALTDALEMALRLADIEVADIEATDAARAARREPPLRETTIARALALSELASLIDIAEDIDGLAP